MNRYQGIPITKEDSGKRAYVTSRYPEVPLSENDIYVYTTQGDRYDVLALNYYGDSSLWWVISIANPNIGFNSLVIPEGLQIRIPAFYAGIISAFNVINS